MAKKDEKTIEALGAFIARIEREAQPLPVVQISHPDAKDGEVYEGTYAGIRQVKGEPGAILSDGSKI